jgi:hypothetical protein
MGFAERLARALLPIAAAIVIADCTVAPAQPYNEPLARRCAELLAIFDKYGVQHSQGSGGPGIIYVGPASIAATAVLPRASGPWKICYSATRSLRGRDADGTGK